jgi:hypothetical protein
MNGFAALTVHIDPLAIFLPEYIEEKVAKMCYAVSLMWSATTEA